MDELEMMALQGMMGPDMGAPMDPMMDPGMGMDDGMGGMDPLGVTELPIPNFAVPAVLELVSLLEQTLDAEMGAMPADAGMDMGGMPMDMGGMDF